MCAGQLQLLFSFHVIETILNLLLHLFIVYVLGQGQLARDGSLFPPSWSQHQTQVVRLGSERFYPPSQPNNFNYFFNQLFQAKGGSKKITRQMHMYPDVTIVKVCFFFFFKRKQSLDVPTKASFWSPPPSGVGCCSDLSLPPSHSVSVFQYCCVDGPHGTIQNQSICKVNIQMTPHSTRDAFSSV